MYYQFLLIFVSVFLCFGKTARLKYRLLPISILKITAKNRLTMLKEKILLKKKTCKKV